MHNHGELKYGISSDHFFSFIDNMYDEVLVCDNNYRIVYISQACSRNYSCSPDMMVGKSFFDFVDEYWWAPSILPVEYKEKKIFRHKTEPSRIANSIP